MANTTWNTTLRRWEFDDPPGAPMRAYFPGWSQASPRSLDTTTEEIMDRVRGFTPHGVWLDEAQPLDVRQQGQLQEAILTMELVPRPCWWANLRKYLPAADWRTCQKFVRDRAKGLCEVCGGRASRELDCHEMWAYDDENHVQMLTGLIGLCQLCHGVKHMGFQATKGPANLGRHIEHLARVNLWDPETCEFYIEEEFARHAIRSDHFWTQNLEWLPLALGIPVDIPVGKRADPDAEML